MKKTIEKDNTYILKYLGCYYFGTYEECKQKMITIKSGRKHINEEPPTITIELCNIL